MGGDNHSTHIYTLPPIDGFEPFLQAVDSRRRIQQDILAKATPGTVEWMFKANYFTTWWDGKGNSKALWGSGMREPMFFSDIIHYLILFAAGAGKTVLT